MYTHHNDNHVEYGMQNIIWGAHNVIILRECLGHKINTFNLLYQTRVLAETDVQIRKFESL